MPCEMSARWRDLSNWGDFCIILPTVFCVLNSFFRFPFCRLKNLPASGGLARRTGGTNDPRLLSAFYPPQLARLWRGGLAENPPPLRFFLSNLVCEVLSLQLLSALGGLPIISVKNRVSKPRGKLYPPSAVPTTIN